MHAKCSFYTLSFCEHLSAFFKEDLTQHVRHSRRQQTAQGQLGSVSSPLHIRQHQHTGALNACWRRGNVKGEEVSPKDLNLEMSPVSRHLTQE